MPYLNLASKAKYQLQEFTRRQSVEVSTDFGRAKLSWLYILNSDVQSKSDPYATSLMTRSSKMGNILRAALCNTQHGVDAIY